MVLGMVHHYMGTEQQTRVRVPTGILSEGEREFFKGRKEVEDPDGYRRNARYRARQRMDQIEDDLAELRDAGEDDIVDEFYERFSRASQLEQRVEELEEKLNGE